jgi:hypothetical protein
MSVIKETVYAANVQITKRVDSVDNYNGVRNKAKEVEEVLLVEVSASSLNLLRDRVVNVINAGLGLDA